MIYVFAPDAVDFTTNGLGPVDPHVCRVTETLNGEWELTLEHMVDDAGKWVRLAERNIVLAPVPAAMTPAMIAPAVQATSVDVYRVQTDGRRLNMRAKPSMDGKIIRAYKPDTEVISLGVSGDWREVTAPDGARGYMWASNTVFVRTETTGAQGAATVVEAKQMRDQPFRIYRVVPSLDRVKVYARHIFYDLMDNMIQSFKPAATATGAQALAGIAAGCLSAHDFTFTSDLSSTAEGVEFENTNPVDAILGADGLIEKYGGELARDWYDVYVVNRVGEDAGVQVREGKNLLGISYDVDLTDVVTRIMPTGEDADGNVLYLPELYIDSPNIGDYTHPKWIHLPVSEAKEVTKGDDKKTKAQCYEEMRAAAQAEYEKSCDLPTVTLKVDFINCADTEEYAQYVALHNIFLGDGVRVLAKRVGVAVTMRLTQYTYDCLTRKYTAMTLGTVADSIEGNMISARQLPGGVISGAKLAINSVGAGQIKDGAVGGLQIGLAAIQAAHIGQAVIENAHIGQAAIGTANIQDLAVTNAKIAALAVDTANIKNLAVDSAKIADLAVTAAKIADAAITNAKIGTAAIETANIKDAAIETAKIALGAITTALIDTGAVGTAQIADASITDGKIVNLSANRITAGVLSVERLIISGSDQSLVFAINNMGELVSATVDTIDAYALTDRTITADKIVAEAITADELAAASVIANKIAAGAVETAKLAAGAVTAIKIASGAIETGHISAGAWNALMVDAQERITLAVTGVQVGGVNLLRGTSGEYEDISLDQYFAALTDRLALTDLGLAAGDVVTLSMTLKAPSTKAVSARITTFSAATGDAGKTSFLGSSIAAGGEGVSALTITIPAGATHLEVAVHNVTSSVATVTVMQVKRVQLERGNKATGWSPHPEEFRAGSSIDIREGSIRMSAPLVEISVPKSESDETVVARFNEDGLYADNVLSPSVAAVYRGPNTLYVNPSATEAQTEAGTHFKSIAAALAALNNRYITYNVTLNLKQATRFYENVRVAGLVGSAVLTITTQDAPTSAETWAAIYGYYLEEGNVARINVENLKIVSTYVDGERDLAMIRRSAFTKFEDMIITGNGYSRHMIRVDSGSRLLAINVEVYNTVMGSLPRAFYADRGSEICCENCKGNLGSGLVLAANQGRILASGTIPYTSGTATAEWMNGEVRAAGVTADAGSSPPAYVPPTTYAYAVTDSRTRSTDSGWFGTGDRSIRQGYAKGLKKLYGCMWFDSATLRSQLAGKTVLSATLHFKCLNNGLDGAKLLFLIGATNTSASGSVAGVQTYGSIGSIAWGEEVELPVPVAAVNHLVAGTVNALGLFNDEGADDLVSGKDYSKRYRRLAGYGADGAPVLTVVTE